MKPFSHSSIAPKSTLVHVPTRSSQINKISTSSSPHSTEHSILQLQKIIGNSNVTSLIKPLRMITQNKPLSYKRSNSPILQGKFRHSEKSNAIYVDETDQQEYEKIETLTISLPNDKVQTIYVLKKEKVTIHIDADTMEIIKHTDPLSNMNTEHKPQTVDDEVVNETESKTENNKKRTLDDVTTDDADYGSDYEENSEDGSKILNPSEKLEFMYLKGIKKRSILGNKRLKSEDGIISGHTSHARHTFISDRQQNSSYSNLGNQARILIGSQIHRLAAGTGYFITPGKNKERNKDVKEPKMDYRGLFDSIREQGTNKDANTFYNKVLNGKRKPKTEFTDYEIATMALYYLKNDAQAVVEKVPRSQLTENLSKFAAITMSEFARSMEATKTTTDEEKKPIVTPIPYDATLLIKQGLTKVIDGKITLQQLFYEGQGGKNSVFIGAPSGKNAPDKIGGAEVLRNPLKKEYADRLERQMSIFPDTLKEFLQSLNNLKTSSKDIMPKSNKDDLKADMQQNEKLRFTEQLENARVLLARIKTIPVPSANEVLDFFNYTGRKKITTIHSLLKEANAIKQYISKYELSHNTQTEESKSTDKNASSKELNEIVQQCIEEIKTLKNKANAVLKQ